MNQKNEEIMANDNSLAGEVTISPQYGEDFVHWKRKTALFITGQTISLFGSSLVQFAIIWYVTLRTQSGMMMTISTICGFLPQLIISLFSGVWADRYNRRVLIMLADGLISSATLVLAILFLLGHDAIWLLFLVSGIRSIGAGIQSPAVQALLPQIVPVDKLMRVNGINGSIGSFIMLLSPIASGAILTIMTVETAFFIDVVTAALAITIMFFLKIPPHKKAAEKQSGGYFDDLKEGFKYVKQNEFIIDLLVFYAIFFFLLVPVMFLTPLLVTRSFGSEVWKLTMNEIVFFVGSAFGGIIVSIWGGFKNKAYTIFISCIVFGVLTVALGLSTLFWIYLAFMLVMGLVVPFFSTAVTVLLQEKVEQDMQGRVFGLIQMVTTAVMPLGMLLFGPMADVVTVEVLLIVTGAFVLILGVRIAFHKRLRSLG